jgi:membrane-bound lytic murein transglycosylase D
MPKFIKQYRHFVLVLLLLPVSGFSQKDFNQNSTLSIKQVDELRIGNKPEINKIELDNPEVLQVKLSPSTLTVVDSRDNNEFHIIPADDEVIAQRIKGLENIMPMPYNEHVKKYVDYFLYQRPNFIKQMLERKEFYFPIFEEYLAKYGIPDEMKYLALLESGLNPTAVSHAKAVGLWQFMAPTGNEYGLKITDYMDERMHIEKSTEASFRYLTWLHNYFHDWELALASYNTGPGNMRRAIRKSGGETDYWQLHEYIHRDTRAYVPQWAALNYLMNYSSEHGIFADFDKTMHAVATENLLLDGPLNLTSFAALNYMDLETLKMYNPHLRKDELPSYAKNVEIKMPVDNYAYYESNKDCILDSACILSTPTFQVATVVDEKGSYHIESKQVKKYYRIRSGDYLGKVASNNGVSVSQLRNWNNLKSSTIQKGQRLVFYKTEAYRVYDTTIDTKEELQKTVVASNNTSERTNLKVMQPSRNVEEVNIIKETKPSSGSHTITKTVKRYYFVKSGDNLTDLARTYGTTISNLKEWNNLKTTKILKGQKLAYYTTITEKVYDNFNEDKSGNVIVHTVQAGDTLWNISQKYGYSIAELKRLNGITGNTVKVGQKLKVKS